MTGRPGNSNSWCTKALCSQKAAWCSLLREPSAASVWLGFLESAHHAAHNLWRMTHGYAAITEPGTRSCNLAGSSQMSVQQNCQSALLSLPPLGKSPMYSTIPSTKPSRKPRAPKPNSACPAPARSLNPGSPMGEHGGGFSTGLFFKALPWK